MLSNQALSTFPEVYNRFREKKSKYSTFSQRKKYVDYYEIIEIKDFLIHYHCFGRDLFILFIKETSLKGEVV